MDKWHMRLRQRAAGWFWECRNPDGVFVCGSPFSFSYRWEAVRNFEHWFADYWAEHRAHHPVAANADVDWECGL